MALSYVLDRFEGETAVLIDKSNKRPRNVSAADLPKGVAVGSTLVDDCGSWSVDNGDAQARAQSIDDKMASVFKR